MLCTSTEERFFPARPRRNRGREHRALQVSQSGGGGKSAVGGGSASASVVTMGNFAILDDREADDSKLADGRSGNLDRFLESTTPTVPAQCLPKRTTREWSVCNVGVRPYFVLGDLWESFKEWSAYGAGVPLIMNGTDCVMQYYVPYLSGIQLYGERRRKPVNLRGLREESDSDCSRDSISDETSDYEVARGLRCSWEDSLSLRGAHVDSQEGSSSDDGEADSTQGLLLFEYLEGNHPYIREPLADKISDLTGRFPGLKTLRSCDLLPSSWVSVAWYPIYRIPTGQTLRDLDACFLTFHSLATPTVESRHGGVGDPAASCLKLTGEIPDISLPTFGLASYKLKGSLWCSNGGSERQLADSLMRAADTWLSRLRVAHPDYQFFASRGTSRR